jgi:hypothetical protein
MIVETETNTRGRYMSVVVEEWCDHHVRCLAAQGAFGIQLHMQGISLGAHTPPLSAQRHVMSTSDQLTGIVDVEQELRPHVGGWGRERFQVADGWHSTAHVHVHNLQGRLDSKAT